MPEQTQTYANHKRTPPPIYLFAATVLLLNFGVALWLVVRRPAPDTFWNVVVAVALALLAWSLREHAVTVQNRVIRLEERLRLTSVLPDVLRERIPELKTSQLVALRFASDDEVTDLVSRTLSGELASPDDIKRQIRNWRADHLRV